MDVSDETLSQLTGDDEWDRKREVFVSLNSAVETLKKTCGYADQDLERLIEIDDIRREIYLEKVTRIAQEEIQAMLDKLTA